MGESLYEITPSGHVRIREDVCRRASWRSNRDFLDRWFEGQIAQAGLEAAPATSETRSMGSLNRLSSDRYPYHAGCVLAIGRMTDILSAHPYFMDDRDKALARAIEVATAGASKQFDISGYDCIDVTAASIRAISVDFDIPLPVYVL